MWKLYWDARDRIDAVAVQQTALDAEWTTVSGDLDTALATRAKSELIQNELAGVLADRARPRWVPALRSVVACAGLEIEVREVRASEKSGTEKIWALLVRGVATGPNPRGLADRYRADLQRDLDRMFPGRVSIAFERFEDMPDAAPATPETRRGAFTVNATIRFEAEATTVRKGGA